MIHFTKHATNFIRFYWDHVYQDQFLNNTTIKLIKFLFSQFGLRWRYYENEDAFIKSDMIWIEFRIELSKEDNYILRYSLNIFTTINAPQKMNFWENDSIHLVHYYTAMTSKDYQTQSNPTKSRFLNILRILTACSSSSVMPMASMTPWAMSSTQFNQTQANPTKPNNTQPNSIKLKQLNSITQPKSIRPKPSQGKPNQIEPHPIKPNQTWTNGTKPNQTQQIRSNQMKSISTFTILHRVSILHSRTQRYITQHAKIAHRPT